MNASNLRQLTFCCLALLAVTAAQAQSAKAGSRERSSTNGIVITGEREGPLGLHLAPWQEPAAILPEAMIQARLPMVLDDPRSLAEDSVNRQFPAPEVVKTPAAGEKKSPRTSRRGRSRDEVPNAVIMQSQPQ